MDNTKITHHITLCFQIVLQKMYPVSPKEQNFGQNPVWFVVWHDFLKKKKLTWEGETPRLHGSRLPAILTTDAISFSLELNVAITTWYIYSYVVFFFSFFIIIF